MDRCKRVIDEGTDHEEECGLPAVKKVKVRGRVGSSLVPLCRKHLAEFNESFAAMRTGSKK